MAVTGDREYEFHQLEESYRCMIQARRDREEEINVGLPRPSPEPGSLRAVILQLRVAAVLKDDTDEDKA